MRTHHAWPLLAAMGCSEILGFEDSPEPSECVRDADCGANELCRGFVCVAEAGSAGEDGGVQGGAAGAAPQAGTGAESGAGAEAGAGGAATKPTMPAIPDGGVCAPGTGVCLECDEAGQWANGKCVGACADDTCYTPPSCNGLPATCGPSDDCCHSIAVPGGDFDRGCDMTCQAVCVPPHDYPARISAFALDAYEVTVGRFRKFVEAYPNSRPAAGAGKNPNNAKDTGWNAAWDEHLPDDADGLRQELSSDACVGSRSWTATPAQNESKPMNCVDWYLAYAFCAWDGGRLPTHAEWTYMAGGGDEGRRYPWSDPPESTVIDGSYAIYQSSPEITGPAAVGSLANGRGKWNHYDLAGNVAEWTLDSFGNCYETPNECRDCADLSADFDFKVVRGGSFLSVKEYVDVAERTAASDTDRYADIGIRCARNL